MSRSRGGKNDAPTQPNLKWLEVGLLMTAVFQPHFSRPTFFPCLCKLQCCAFIDRQQSS